LKSREPESRFAGLSDSALMLLFKDGDERAFDILFERYRNMKKYTSFLVGSEAIAEEIFQETWMNIIRAKDRYAATASFKTYWFTVMNNVVNSHFRKPANKSELHISDDEAEFGDEASLFDSLPSQKSGTVENNSFLAECIESLMKALNDLPLDQREPLLLKIDSDSSIEDIAEIMEVGRETVKSRLRYAMQKLRKQVPSDCYG
jgi:RNA polymerase sigma factor (sigma-70 family)